MKKTLILALVVALSITTAGYAASQMVQGEVSPDFKVYIDGSLQAFKDANGNTVHPVVINGTTYLPLRAVAGAFGKGVNWEPSTKTITVGETAPMSLLDATGPAESEYNKMSKVTGKNNLTFPQIGDVGVEYTSAIKMEGIYGTAYTSVSTLTLNGNYSTLETTLLAVPYANANETRKIMVKIYNADSGTVIFDKTISMSQVNQIAVEINGVRKLKFEASTDAGGKELDLYFLNPIVK